MSLRNIRRLYTTGLSDWTKTSLRRLKKSQLFEIAQENQLKVTGTKNDIIDQLLGYQDTKQNPLPPPPPSQHIVEKINTQHIPEETPTENDMAQDWVKAFDMKVAHRGSSFKRPFDSKGPSPIFRPDVEKKKIVIPVEKIREQVASQPILVQDVEDVEGMDALWVEAFDRKASTRGSRHQLADTLSSEPKLNGLGLEFASFESPKDAPMEEKEIEPKIEVKEKVEPSTKEVEQKIESSIKQEEKIKKNDEITHHAEQVIQSEPFTTTTDNEQHNQSNVVSGLVGTSMLVWYFGGGETFQKIWDFFGSS